MKIGKHFLDEELKIDGKGKKIAIILPYFNQDMGIELYLKTKKSLEEHKANVELFRVAGSLEIPFCALQLIKSKKYDAIICLGVIIRGETTHYDLVSENVYQGLMKLQLQQDFPITFGILTCENEQQALERIKNQKPEEFAISTLIQLTHIK
jgi:6,7-dimethyl-8-ribityllumazine synthase